MRLINTKTGLLEEFFGGDPIPKYAILSHTWEKDEITLQELRRAIDPDLADDPKTWVLKEKAGFIKVLEFVRLAASKGIPYAWADTCCIDKTSSAELTESINSMYRWYKNSEVCITYLTDVVSPTVPSYKSDSYIAKSRWFTRGWTLQELMAPLDVEFYDYAWVFLGNKDDRIGDIESITGINRKIFEENDLSSVSVAQKMSWAANRVTTRKEDMAYCLLGIFDVNMPLLYGEGEKAFLRLQEHIAAASTDHSLFAWGIHESFSQKRKAQLEQDQPRFHQSIFASSPNDFVECGEMESLIFVHPDAWTQTNRGLHAVFPTVPVEVAKGMLMDRDLDPELPDYIDEDDHLVILNCGKRCKSAYEDGYFIGIWITMTDPRHDGNHGFLRVSDRVARLDSYMNFGDPESFPKMDLWMATSQTVKMSPMAPSHFSKRLGGFLITSDGMSPMVHAVYGAQAEYWSGKYDSVLQTPHFPLNFLGGLVGVATFRISLVYSGESEEEFAIVFGYPPGVRRPFAAIVEDFDHEAPLNHDLQRYAPFKMDQDRGAWVTDYEYDRDCLSTYINVSLATVLLGNMIFTELRMKSRRQEL